MAQYILFGVCVIIGYIVIFSLLTVASKFDDEVEELYYDYHDDLDTNEEYDYYEEKYKNITNENNNNSQYSDVWYWENLLKIRYTLNIDNNKTIEVESIIEKVNGLEFSKVNKVILAKNLSESNKYICEY